MPGVPQRDHPEAGAASTQREHAGQVARLDRGSVLRGEDQAVAVLPELPGSFPVAGLLGMTHPQRLEAERGQRREVVGVLGLGLAVQDLPDIGVKRRFSASSRDV